MYSARELRGIPHDKQDRQPERFFNSTRNTASYLVPRLDEKGGVWYGDLLGTNKSLGPIFDGPIGSHDVNVRLREMVEQGCPLIWLPAGSFSHKRQKAADRETGEVEGANGSVRAI